MELTKAVIFFVGFLVAVCSGLPTSSKDDVEAVTPVKTYGNQPIVDTGVFSGWENPFAGNSFGGLFDNIDSIMERMRQQISTLLSKFPGIGSGNSTQDIPAFPGLEHPAFPILTNIDLSKGNTTSVTKIIDGHKVVINETEYKKEDDFGGTFFKVRIVDVKPDSSEVTTEREAEGLPEQTTKYREEIANSIENEITKSKEGEQDNISLYDNLPRSNQYQNLESFEEVASLENLDNTPATSTNKNLITSRFDTEWPIEDFNTNNAEWDYASPIKPVDTNNIETSEKEYERRIPIDLSRDTYVNEILAQMEAPMNPDAEVFEVGSLNRSPQSFEKFINPR